MSLKFVHTREKFWSKGRRRRKEKIVYFSTFNLQPRIKVDLWFMVFIMYVNGMGMGMGTGGCQLVGWSGLFFFVAGISSYWISIKNMP